MNEDRRLEAQALAAADRLPVRAVRSTREDILGIWGSSGHG